jgi:hypothetical protein
MKKNTCWFFGDSFTENAFKRKGSEYREFLKIDNDIVINSWTELLANKLDMNHRVIAKGGRSTQHIFTEVLHNFFNFKKGDWVIVGDSPPIRTVGVNYSTKKITTFNNEQLNNGRFDIGEIYGQPNHGIPIDDEDLARIYVDYLYNFIFPYESIWKEYWRQNITEFNRILRTSGINSIYWSNRLWDEFTSIQDETNGGLSDSHWGVVGSQEFFEYLMENIKKENYILLTREQKIL